MNTPSWTDLFTVFSAVYTTASNSSCYSIDSSGEIYSYEITTGTWGWMASPSTSPIVAISASIDGSITVLDSDSSAFLYSYGAWNNICNSALNAAVGDASHYVVVETSGLITKTFNSTTTTISGTGGVPTKLSATANLAQIVGVDGTGKVYQRGTSSWATISGKTLKQVDVSLSASGSLQICGVDASGNGWTYNSTVWSPLTKPAGVTKFVSLEAGINTIYATSSAGGVYLGTF